MKKNKLILLQLFCIFALLCTSVYAAINTTVELKVSKDVVQRGETVSVTLSLKDVADDKIESVESYINYDKNVIEPINVDSIEKNDDNTVTIGEQKLPIEDLTNSTVENVTSTTEAIAFNGNPEGDENDTRILIDFKEPIVADSDIITIKFKVKSDSTLGEIEKAITYSMVVVTNSNGEQKQITKDIKLTVNAVSTPGDSDGDDDTNTNRNTNTNTNTNKNTNSNTNTNKNTNSNTNTNTNKNTNVNSNKADNTLVGAALPATGARMIIVPVVVLIIVAYIFYNRYMKYKDI